MAAALALGLAACDGSSGDDATRAAMGGPGPMMALTPAGPMADPAVVTPGALPIGAGAAGACDLSLVELAAYQAVKVPLHGDGESIEIRNADLVARRGILFRALVSPEDGWGMRAARVRLTLTSVAGVRRFEDAKVIAAASTDGEIAGSFNFDVDDAAITEDARVVVEIVEPTSCARKSGAARVPGTGELALRARATGVLKLVLVPIRYQSDGSGRLPDTSEEQLNLFRDSLMALYPIEDVEISVRQPVGTNLTLGNSGWGDLLDALRVVRSEDGAAEDAYYYGLVSPAQTFTTFCRGSCTAGVSYQAPTGRPGQRVGVGVGFPGVVAADTLSHELGHQHGRGHAPCLTRDGVDAAYPYPGGGIGVWGFDRRKGMLISPTGRSDIMGYCKTPWISDYTFQALLERSAQVNLKRQALRLEPEPRAVRALLVDGAGRARWGLPSVETWSLPPGDPEPAIVRDATGVVVATIDVYRLPLADADGATVLVPASRPGWHTIEVAGSAPMPFAAPSSVRRLFR